MAIVTTFETAEAGSSGAISRDKNTRRLFVDPGLIQQAAVTGTWTLAIEITDVLSLQTDDAGTTNVFHIPFPESFSDLTQKSGAGVDRGVQIIGLEVLYQVATSDIAAFALAIHRKIFTSIGTPSSTAMTTTASFDAGDATGLTQVHHRAKAFIAAGNREFLDAGSVVFGKLSITDGTSSDVNIHGAIWHYRFVEE